MDAHAGRVLAELLAQRNGDAPTQPIRGLEGHTDAAPIFVWFGMAPPRSDDEPSPSRPA